MKSQREMSVHERNGFWVRTRVGWGWEVRGPEGFASEAFGTQQEAIDLVDKLAAERTAQDGHRNDPT